MKTSLVVSSKRRLLTGLVAGSALLAVSALSLGAGPAAKPMGGCLTQQSGDTLSLREQRLAQLKEQLKLQPNQESAWQAFTQTLPDPAFANRAERQAERQALARLSTPERMDRMLAKADERRTRMVQRAEAVKKFYAQLSPEQRQVFDAQSASRGQGRHGHFRHGGGQGRQA